MCRLYLLHLQSVHSSIRKERWTPQSRIQATPSCPRRILYVMICQGPCNHALIYFIKVFQSPCLDSGGQGSTSRSIGSSPSSSLPSLASVSFQLLIDVKRPVIDWNIRCIHPIPSHLWILWRDILRRDWIGAHAQRPLPSFLWRRIPVVCKCNVQKARDGWR